MYIRGSKKRVAGKVSRNQAPNQLYVPRNSNHAVIDAWMPGMGAFQMTVGKNHDIKSGAQDQLKILGKESQKLYWLLPELYYSSFTKKSPQVIDQYAMLIPYPN